MTDQIRDELAALTANLSVKRATAQEHVKGNQRAQDKRSGYTGRRGPPLYFGRGPKRFTKRKESDQ